MTTLTDLLSLQQQQADLTAQLQQVQAVLANARNDALISLRLAEQDEADALELLKEAQERVAKYREVLGLNAKKAAPVEKNLLQRCQEAMANPVFFATTKNINLRATAERHNIPVHAFTKMVREHHLV